MRQSIPKHKKGNKAKLFNERTNDLLRMHKSVLFINMRQYIIFVRWNTSNKIPLLKHDATL